MRRSTVSHHDVEAPVPSPPPASSSSSSTDSHPKRSLEDYGFSSSSVQSKRRRHLSPQNSNIDVKCEANEPIASPILRKTTRSKVKLNSSIDDRDESSPMKKRSSRQTTNSSQQMNELTLPIWERICPNIDQILSTNHTQSGVFAHEVQLVQQELEALLSMSIVRETILKDFQHSSTSNADNLRSKIRKHQEAERFYSSKKLSKKSSSNCSAQKNPQTSTPFVLDRQVTIAPIVGARIDRIWSDVDEYFCQITSNDIDSIENLVEFHRNFLEKLERISPNDSSTFIDELKSMNFQPFRSFVSSPSVLSHYLDRTTLGCFQKKLYEQIGRTSPVYRTPISSPMHQRLFSTSSTTNPNGNDLTTTRVSPRLHPKIDENESFKTKRKGKFVPSPTSAMKFQQRLQYVQNYLVDQHLNEFQTVKRQLFSSTKKRTTTTSNNVEINDELAKKRSNLISLVKECHLISSSALKRAKLQREQENLREKLRTIEDDVRPFVEKIDFRQTSTNEKNFLNLKQMLNEWQKVDEQFRDVSKRLSPCDP